MYIQCSSAFLLPSGATTPVRHHASDTAFFRSLRETCRVLPERVLAQQLRAILSARSPSFRLKRLVPAGHSRSQFVSFPRLRPRASNNSVPPETLLKLALPRVDQAGTRNAADLPGF